MKSPVVEARLLESAGGDAAGAARLLGKFCEVAAADLDSLQQAETGEAIARAAHRLKGAALAVGAWEVSALAARLEGAARAAETEPPAENVMLQAELHVALDRVAQLARWMQARP